ncbi:hypothetical protein ZIOFF_074309 (mitochondrion) [Zingiber officinale]|uniref:Uncharacterized protein n=1 Tax=Zingiber officinale TaxID=94328 RepID=A0A8J5BVC8_ZINOF|nr:hypothetical protein ZIOFF_074309 [Zingiber officinale]
MPKREKTQGERNEDMKLLLLFLFMVLVPVKQQVRVLVLKRSSLNVRVRARKGIERTGTKEATTAAHPRKLYQTHTGQVYLVLEADFEVTSSQRYILEAPTWKSLPNDDRRAVWEDLSFYHEKVEPILMGIFSHIGLLGPLPGRFTCTLTGAGKRGFFAIDKKVPSTVLADFTLRMFSLSILHPQQIGGRCLWWNVFLTHRPLLILRKARYLNFATGQPLGYYGSWALFSLSHHFLLWCGWLRGFFTQGERRLLEKVCPSRGDDIVIADRAVAEKYKALLDILIHI